MRGLRFWDQRRRLLHGWSGLCRLLWLLLLLHGGDGSGCSGWNGCGGDCALHGWRDRAAHEWLAAWTAVRKGPVWVELARGDLILVRHISIIIFVFTGICVYECAPQEHQLLYGFIVSHSNPARVAAKVHIRCVCVIVSKPQEAMVLCTVALAV
jgi:hypothetical protein